MLDHRMVEGLMEAIAPIVREVRDAARKEVEAANAQIAELRAEIDLIKAMKPDKGEPGKDGTNGRDGVDGKDAVVDLEELARRAAELIPTPKDGENGKDGVDGKDGASLTIKDVEPMLNEMVDRAVSFIDVPQPKEIDQAAIAKMISGHVLEAVSKIEVPKGVTIEDVLPEIHKAVAEHYEANPPAAGKDGKSVALSDVVDEIRKAVAEEYASKPPADGKPGKDGKDGVDGKDADPEFIVASVERAVGERVPVSQMVNDKGVLVATYKDGSSKDLGRVRGASVMDGKVDEDGILVLRMSDGRELKTGIVKGEDGKPGDKGESGRAGRDALEIQIMPGIDEAKSYPEGVYARWRGGVIRSDRQTDPMPDGDAKNAGWSVILEGIFEETEHSVDGGRFIERETVYTSGNSFRRRIKTEAVIERGVWVEEKQFLKGDGVTWGGQFYIAQQDDPTDKPGVSSQWRLSIKRGRDGKDLTAKPPRGPVRLPGN